MKVVCINDSFIRESEKVPLLKKGSIYNILEEREVKDFVSRKKHKRAEDGVYYSFIETGYWYHSSLFIKINDELIAMSMLIQN
jgi:hypothetical protein